MTSYFIHLRIVPVKSAITALDNEYIASGINSINTHLKKYFGYYQAEGKRI
jgi:hypothetical protein